MRPDTAFAIRFGLQGLPNPFPGMLRGLSLRKGVDIGAHHTRN